MPASAEAEGPVRVAMWSGPRNLSTAMMRSFGARADCAVWDEPFYAAYLHATGIDHPMREAVLARYDTDPASVAKRCLGPPDKPAAIFYQKHMAHHMVDGFDLAFVEGLTNAFLIRDPARVVASYERKREAVTLADLGYERQAALFRREAERLGRAPPVIDASAVLADPERTLRALCGALAIPFDPAMLSWPPGPREEDGVWARHWYGAVERSTGFAPEGEAAPLHTDGAKRLVAAAMPLYERLARYAL